MNFDMVSPLFICVLRKGTVGLLAQQYSRDITGL
jgi:hypothetical protein